MGRIMQGVSTTGAIKDALSRQLFESFARFITLYKSLKWCRIASGRENVLRRAAKVTPREDHTQRSNCPTNIFVCEDYDTYHTGTSTPSQFRHPGLFAYKMWCQLQVGVF